MWGTDKAQSYGVIARRLLALSIPTFTAPPISMVMMGQLTFPWACIMELVRSMMHTKIEAIPSSCK